MSSEPPPWAQPAAPPAPLSRRRVTLLVVAGLLVVALVVSILTLRSVLESVVAVDTVERVASVDVDLADCDEQFPEWVDGLIETESSRIVQLYGTGPVTAAAYRHPEGFPTMAVTWAGIVPTCGTTLVIPDGTGVAFYLDAAESSRTQFEALSSMLTALGYAMTADEVDRELLQVEGDDPVDAGSGQTAAPGDAPTGPVADDGEEPAASTSAYRYFRLPDGRRLWAQFDPADVEDPDGSGDLYLGYFPAA